MCDTDKERAVFHNRLRILLNIDREEINEEFGSPISDETWVSFRNDPLRYFINSPVIANALWRIVMRREQRGAAALETARSQ